MKDIKTLNKTASDFIAERKKSAPDYAPDVKTALEDRIAHEVTLFNNWVREDTRTADAIAIAIVPVKTAIADFNDLVRNYRLQALSDMKHTDAVKDFLREQCVTGYAVDVEEDGTLSKKTADVPVDSYEFIKTICSADLNGIIDACAIFADNVARYAIGDACSVTSRAMHKDYIELRNRKGWNTPKDKLSKSVLAKQLTEVVSFIAKDIGLRMENPDVTYIIHGLIMANDRANSAGSFVKREEKTLIRFIFRAMYTRYNKLAYQFQDKTRTDKAPLTTSNNKPMGEAPAKAEATVEAGPVKTESAPAKKTAKKSAPAKADKTESK